MEPRTPRPLDRPRFGLADHIARRLSGRAHADDDVRRAVAILTASADPARAEQLRPGAGEAGPLIERLAVWALHRASDDAVRLAARQLSGIDTDTTIADTTDRRRVTAPNDLDPRERVLTRVQHGER